MSLNTERAKCKRGSGVTGILPCTSTPSTSQANGSANWSQSNERVVKSAAVRFGFVAATAESRRPSDCGTLDQEQPPAADATAIRRWRARFESTVTRRAAKLAPSIHRGHRCIPAAATRTTTAGAATAAEESRFANAGRLSKHFLRIWAKVGERGFPSIASTTTAITSPIIVVGPLHQSRRSTAADVAADQYPFRFKAVKARAKRDGGGWAEERF